jgi:hypothetical protein
MEKGVIAQINSELYVAAKFGFLAIRLTKPPWNETNKILVYTTVVYILFDLMTKSNSQ